MGTIATMALLKPGAAKIVAPSATSTNSSAVASSVSLRVPAQAKNVRTPMRMKRNYMHVYMVTKDRINPGILVIDGCHPNHLGHAAIYAKPLMALTASYFL
jgi:hypothetical protein